MYSKLAQPYGDEAIYDFKTLVVLLEACHFDIVVNDVNACIYWDYYNHFNSFVVNLFYDSKNIAVSSLISSFGLTRHVNGPP